MNFRFDEQERILDSRFLSTPRMPINPLNSNDDDPSIETSLANYVTKRQFDQIIGNLYNTLIMMNKNNEIISKENKEIKEELSYLKSIVMKQFLENVSEKSHENICKLRDILELPPITEKTDALIINELDGVLDDIADEGEFSVEALKTIRGA